MASKPKLLVTRRLPQAVTERLNAAYDAVTKALRPGCTAADLRAAGQVIVDRGYQIVAPLVHGVFNPIDAGPFVGRRRR